MIVLSDKNTEVRLNWYDAALYCFALGDDWRLPSIKELLDLYQTDNDFSHVWYWTYDECHNKGRAWDVNFANGKHANVDKEFFNYVRAVKTTYKEVR